MISHVSTHRITFGLIVFGSIFVVMSTAGDYWEAASISGETLNIGLWRGCGFISGKKTCLDRPKNGALTATWILMIMGCLGYLIVLTYSSILFFKKDLSMKLLAVGLDVTAFFLMVGLGVYTVMLSTSELTYSWSYTIGWCSAVAALLAGGLCLLDRDGYQSLA